MAMREWIERRKTYVTERKFPRHPSAFINALADEGTREEMVFHLQETWNELREVMRALRELLRLYDWRQELARIEADEQHDKKQMKAWLLQYGMEKKAAWACAREALGKEAVAPPLENLEGLFAKLAGIMVGGCTCATKTPELRFHDPLCHFRLAAEIEEIMLGVPASAKPPAPA